MPGIYFRGNCVRIRLNSELAEARLSLERSENRNYLQFVEASYDTEDRDDFGQAFSIRFGVSIPVVNPNRLDVNRRKLASLKAESDHVNSKKSANREIAALSRNLRRLIRQYGVLTDKKKDSGAESSYKIFRRVEGVSPLILLKLKESMMKTDIAGEKTARRLYVRYVRLLDVSGRPVGKAVEKLSDSGLEGVGTMISKRIEPNNKHLGFLWTCLLLALSFFLIWSQLGLFVVNRALGLIFKKGTGLKIDLG